MGVPHGIRRGPIEGVSRCARRALIVWVYAGTASVETAATMTTLSAGQVALVAAGLRYRIRGDEDAVIVPVELPVDMACPAVVRTAVAVLPDSLRLRLLFEFAQNLGYLKHDATRTDFVRALAAEIIAAQEDAVPVLVVPQPHSEEATAVAATVMADLSVNRSVAELAGIAGASVRTVQRRFRAETTLSVSRWITRVRLNEAIALIARGRSLQFAAHSTGYPGASELIRAFRAETGMTPAAALARESCSEVAKISLADPGVPENETWRNINRGDIFLWVVTGRATVTAGGVTTAVGAGQGVVLPANVAVHVAMAPQTLVLPLGFRYPDDAELFDSVRALTVVDLSDFGAADLLRTAVSTYTQVAVPGSRHDDIFRVLAEERIIARVPVWSGAGEGRSGSSPESLPEVLSRQRHNYVRRMTLARILLAQGKSPTETARTLRYAHAAAFTRAFATAHSMTPKQYSEIAHSQPGPVMVGKRINVPPRYSLLVDPGATG
ncbi:helix-turn-helix domain-containing protein [Corynebacterium sp. CCM 9204]|uniref:helix-turn-helix domain-containing protein n=1 Tax=Corynebacterium sp. CCM 9204 TaxID=3057616 RepID=UPI003523C5AB